MGGLCAKGTPKVADDGDIATVDALTLKAMPKFKQW